MESLKNSSTRVNFLVLNNNAQESALLNQICRRLGPVYSSASLDGAIQLLTTHEILVAVVDASLASYSNMRGLFKGKTSIVITGTTETQLRSASRGWPLDRYIRLYNISDLKPSNSSVPRVFNAAADHARLLTEVNGLRGSLDQRDVRIENAWKEIQSLKRFIENSTIKEYERRLSIEVEYRVLKHQKHKIEYILKKLYMAEDVTSLLDIVYDIKKLIRAEGITLYIVDEKESAGRCLKPLVWDGSILMHSEFNKQIIQIDAPDLAAITAREGSVINTSIRPTDARFSDRYRKNLKSPINAILSMPIKQKQEVIGVIELYRQGRKNPSTPIRFTDNEQGIIQQLSEHIAIAINKLNLIQYDALTGLLRPDPFFTKVIKKLSFEFKRHREEAGCALVMGDVDWFKHYNDRNGHEAGNRLLRELAGILRASVRGDDLICRYGGEEFLFFLPGMKNEEESLLFTDRMKKNVEEYYFPFQEFQPRNNLTMSFGITNFKRERLPGPDNISNEDLKRLINEADTALAAAKGKASTLLRLDMPTEENPDKNNIRIYKGIELPEPASAADHVTQEQSENRRRHQRFPSTATLIYKSGNERKVTKAINMCLGGARILSDVSLQIGQALDLTLILRDAALECKGYIVYSRLRKEPQRSFMTGLKFSELSLNDRHLLESYFDRLARNGAGLN